MMMTNPVSDRTLRATSPARSPARALFRPFVAAALTLAAAHASFAQTTPPVTSGLVLRLESESGIVKSSTGAVTRWTDQSSMKNDLFGSGDPALKSAATPSGKPAVSLDGSGDKFERSAPNYALNGFPTGNANRTVFLVARYEKNSAWSGFAYGAGKANAAFGVVARPSGGELTAQGWGTSNDHVSSTRIFGNWQLLGATHQDGTVRLYRDGSQVLSKAHKFATTNTKVVLGQEIAQLGYSTMDVAAVLVYNRALNSTERASVESYLRGKYLQATATNMAPKVSISSPTSGGSVTAGTSVKFAGTATDQEDGTLSASLEWRSDRDGLLGRGASLTTSKLTVGSHTITASVTDSRGAKDSARITYTIKALSSPAPAPAPDPVPTSGSKISLFNGKDLSGLYVWSAKYGRSDPTGVFRVQNGLIRVASDLPYAVLTTEKEYSNYIMVLEFKWGTATYGDRTGKARDAGVLVHSHGRDGSWRGRHMAGIESQVMEGAMGDLMLLRDTTSTATPIRMSVACSSTSCGGGTSWYCRGHHRWTQSSSRKTFQNDLDTVHWYGWDPAWKDVVGYRGRTNVEKPNGEWNQMIVVCDGDRIEVFVNGVKVNEAFSVSPSRGKIQLQSEQAEYYIRRWELQMLD